MKSARRKLRGQTGNFNELCRPFDCLSKLRRARSGRRNLHPLHLVEMRNMATALIARIRRIWQPLITCCCDFAVLLGPEHQHTTVVGANAWARAATAIWHGVDIRSRRN